MNRVIGIDIGTTGAVALLADRDLVAVLDMPTLPDGPAHRPSVSAPLLADIVRQLAPGFAYVEHIGPRPTDGAKSAFAFGAARATVEAVLLVLGVPFTTITPATWKRTIGIPAGKGLKGLSRSAAIRRWPAQAALFAREHDHDRADAALIAWAGIERDANKRAAA